MKSSIFLIAIILLSISIKSHSQNPQKKIKLPNNEYTLQEALRIIGNQSGYSFSYNFKKINPKYPITVSKHCFETVDDALNAILPDGMKHTTNQKFIIIQVTSKTKDFIHIDHTNKLLTPNSNKKIESQIQLNVPKTNNENSDNTSSLSEYRVDSVQESPLIKTSSTNGNTQKKDTIINRQNKPVSRLDSPTQQTEKKTSSPIHFGKNRLLLELELSGFHLLGCGALHFGFTKFYGIVSCATNLKESTFVGAGIGSQLVYYNNFSLTTEISYHLLVGGSIFDSDVKANVIQFKPLINYQLFNNFNVFVGPEIFSLNRSQINEFTSQRVNLEPQIGIGGIIGIKYCINKIQTK